MSARVSAVAARARLTEGQLYSCAITLAAAALLATGLGDVHGVVGAALSQPPLALPAAEAPAPVVVPGPVATPVALPPPFGPPLGAEPVSPPEPPFEPEPEPSPVVVLPSPSPGRPAPTPCDNQAVMDAGRTVVETLDGGSGGQLPEKDLLAALGTITGCDPTDPAVLAVGLLVGAGYAVPDPGFPAPPPVIPFITIPEPVVVALQPVRAELDAVCGLIGTGNTLGALFLWAYPTPVPQVTAQAMFQALAACGQVRP